MRRAVSWGVALAFLLLALDGAGDVNFTEAPGSPFDVDAQRPRAVATGDFNNDGKLDLVVASLRCDPEKDPRATCSPTSREGQVSILLGDGRGGFAEFIESDTRRSPFGVAGEPAAIAVGDFDADGNHDFVTAHPGFEQITIRRGNGKVDFYRERYPRVSQVTVPGGPTSIALGDFNDDRKLDIATANIVGDSVSLLLGDGTGQFASPVNFSVGNGPQSIVTGDFNKDGNLDLATANADKGESISILLGNGRGVFEITHIGFNEMPDAIAVGDFNKDGNPDLVVANTAPDTISVLLGNGDGTFTSPRNFPAGIDPVAIAMADFDKDGKQDIVVVSGSKNNLSILLGDGSGNFALASTYPAGKVPLSVAVGDFNRDGKPDIATANQGSNDVTVLLNR